MEKAWYYEMIIRLANNNCGRYGVAGADADIFRGLEIAYSKDHKGNYDHSEFERGLRLGMVSAFLMDAIERLIKSGKYNDKINSELQGCYDDLIYPSLKIVDDTIDKVKNLVSPI